MSDEALVNQSRLKRLRIGFGVLASALGICIVGIIWLANRGELNQHIQVLISFRHADKLWHFVLMGGLSLLVNLAFMAKRIHVAGCRFLLGSSIVATFVTLEELSQGFLPTRTLELYDWLADMAGIVLFGQIALLFVWFVNKPKKRDQAS